VKIPGQFSTQINTLTALPPVAASLPVCRPTGLAIAQPAFPATLAKNSAERPVALAARADSGGLFWFPLSNFTRSKWSFKSGTG